MQGTGQGHWRKRVRVMALDRGHHRNDRDKCK